MNYENRNETLEKGEEEMNKITTRSNSATK